ncbi:hypothetical protein COEREDRAFT_103252 [Coemansia reversa NRRL 1564]|uniref:Uncharacterized protein n=1 Tax=Coemansia reversa (strain ATCC 12441 / NRRL 1564) TaxID=763665 RepID=A0A2G5B740_COERN|nr:hypothetical protein COEREDRAFT_103252 [Coemansia reversa NRRL 1564]|eukprot:PIA14804.1 hypothetical protein COEREDRAFT_103252 [Coemansia reversa NRRL 1564]
MDLVTNSVNTITSKCIMQTAGRTAIQRIVHPAEETVFCGDNSCGQSQDWLTHKPNVAAGWITGSISLVWGLALAVGMGGWHSWVFADGVLAMIELCISQYLRAAVGMSLGNTKTLYKVSIFFNYHAGIELAHVLTVLTIQLVEHFNPLLKQRWWQRHLVLASRLVNVGLMAIVLAGVVVMFDAESNGPGLRLLQGVSFAVVLLCVGLCIAAAALTMGKIGAALYKRHYAVLFISLGLLGVWAAYCGSRGFVALDSPARNSQVAFYLLSYVPLMLIVAVFVTSKAALYFNFELASYWHSRS